MFSKKTILYSLVSLLFCNLINAEIDKKNVQNIIIETTLDENGFNKKGINKDTGTDRDLKGYDIDGFNKKGYHKDTGTLYNPSGIDLNQLNIKNYWSNKEQESDDC